MAAAGSLGFATHGTKMIFLSCFKSISYRLQTLPLPLKLCRAELGRGGLPKTCLHLRWGSQLCPGREWGGYKGAAGQKAAEWVYSCRHGGWVECARWLCALREERGQWHSMLVVGLFSCGCCGFYPSAVISAWWCGVTHGRG